MPNGAHVVIYSSADLPLEEIAADPGVTETAGPYALVSATLTSGTVESAVNIRGVGPTPSDRHHTAVERRPMATGRRQHLNRTRTGHSLSIGVCPSTTLSRWRRRAARTTSRS